MDIFVLTIEVAFLIAVSAVCSGLNVAIMSLSLGDLKRKAKLGNTYAKRVLPLRRNSHLTLASILLVNVAVISANSLVLEKHLGGLMAGISSTLLIVILGEILPQALFTHNALKFCGRLAPLLRAMIIITYPIAKPLQLLLDKLFGRTESALQSRNELSLLITEHLSAPKSELDDDEVEIMRHALQLSEKRVRDIMTPIKNAYWFTPSTKIDAQRIDEIKDRGWSRIPIVNREMTIFYGVILMKDMVDIDFDEHALRADELPLYNARAVNDSTALDTLLHRFVNAKSHLMAVERRGGKIIGIVTIEDLLEEIVGFEIRDETDRAAKRQ
jgi:metal transporter CNNM